MGGFVTDGTGFEYRRESVQLCGSGFRDCERISKQAAISGSAVGEFGRATGASRQELSRAWFSWALVDQAAPGSPGLWSSPAH